MTGGRLLPAGAGLIGSLWLLSRRRVYRRSARALTDDERSRLGPCFSPELLDTVRVADVARLENPAGYRVARRLGFGAALDLTTVGGMAFVDTVVIVERRGKADRIGTLFHELVHVAQFRVLGVRGFTREYVRGWLECGREYLRIPLERDAYELQARFMRGEAFVVEAEVAGRLRQRSRAG